MMSSRPQKRFSAPNELLATSKAIRAPNEKGRSSARAASLLTLFKATLTDPMVAAWYQARTQTPMLSRRR
jgi:hypothetical protein